MKAGWPILLAALTTLALVGCSALPAYAPTSPPIDTSSPAATGSLASADPFALLSQESLLAFVEDLAAIQPYSGWRNSASEGEAEALDYVTRKLGELQYLSELGVELERQSFHVFLSTELWETALHLVVDGQEVKVPANGLRGPRDEIEQALRFDSDGTLNDARRDPVVVEGPAVLIRSVEEAQALPQNGLQGKIVLLDYAAVDRALIDTQKAVEIASELIEKRPGGLVLVTSFSNQQGESHGAFVGDASALNQVQTDLAPPTLYVRLEDLAPAGIATWEDLARVESARLTWDADVLSPGTSGNVVARIPGIDPSRAMILGAHIDSPNSPGALDDGSGSAILLEVARVLDASRTQPPIDLYLAWFGSEELGLYGSSYFANTHQELLDRTLAMLQTDMLSRPLDGLSAKLTLVAWPYSQSGDDRLLWPDYLAQAAAERGVSVTPQGIYEAYSDNSNFNGYDVPNADLIYEPQIGANISIHNACHVHDPYDTVDLAREMGDVLEQMARVVLAAALDAGQDVPSLRVAPRPKDRALFVGSHTEVAHMTPSNLTELGMALAMEGFDVDLIPYGRAVTPADLESTDLVIVLPVIDYPSATADPVPYDDGWTPEEVAALETYVREGGLLVLTNSARRLKFGNLAFDPNEDWSDANALASRFGITYREGAIAAGTAQPEGDHRLVEGVNSLEFGAENGVPFRLAESAKGQVLARAGGEPVAALLEVGDAGGQVLVLADVTILSAGWSTPNNLPFWRNLARYARH
jgi:hypothetical protein